AAAGAGGGLAALERIDGLCADQRGRLESFLSPPGSLALLLPGLAIAGCGAAGLVRLRRDGRSAVWCAMASAAGLVAWAQWAGVPALDVVKSARPLAEAASAASRQAGDAPIVLYRDAHSHIFNPYLERDRVPKLTGLEPTARFLGRNPGAVVLARREHLPALKRAVAGLRRIGCRRIGGDVVCAAQAPAGR
ncbi:MAG TPA: hypothetical protein VJV23_01225, partial [Candidatus Polarisedimenticolia bacterium]|nr:hypothetical protein [Candidatus Polarisedimenticolia bacterium]